MFPCWHRLIEWLWLPAALALTTIGSAKLFAAPVTQLVRQWEKACETRDIGAWQALFSLEATYEDPLTGRPVRARFHRGPFERLWPTVGKWQCVVREFVPLEDGGAMEWTASATVGERKLEFLGLAVFGVEQAQFSWMRNYFDTRPFLQLLRRPTAPEGR